MKLREEDLLSSVKEHVIQVQEKMISLHQQSGDPTEVIRFRTEATDQLLLALYRLAETLYRRQNGETGYRSALVSQGGYGRGELCLHSDIDLLFLYEGRSTGFVKLLSEKVLQNLWDAGLEVGFATRTVKDCRRLMDEDLTILTSLLDARYLTGDSSLFERFQEMRRRYFSSEEKKVEFLRRKRKENEERREKYGDSLYLLEPNLKEGQGGLRDYHALYWMGRIRDWISTPQDLVRRHYLSEEEFDTLWEALRFLWKVRNELHRRAGRRVDQLLFEYQEPIAHWLGFDDTPHILGVERFMQRYYAEAAAIHRLTEKALQRLVVGEPELFPPPQPLPQEEFAEPLSLLRIFETGRRFRRELDDLSQERIEKNLFRIDEGFRKDPRTGALFRQMLREPVGLGALLTKMNELGVLGAFLPEFAKLHFRVQHDLYHVYTADAHSLLAVGELDRLARGDYARTHATLTAVVGDIERKDLLAFAILYHDIGKGEGKGHVEKGALLIRRAGKRLGFSKEEIETLEFLERSHLIMPHLAFRRDLEDQNLIIQFARTLESQELLNLLYVLTFCDVKAVSSEAMTDWKASLLEYLYLKTREVIAKRAFTKERASALIPKVEAEVLKLLPPAEGKKVREFFAMMPPRYLLAAPPPLIVRHVRLWERFAKDPIVFEARLLEKERLNEVTLLTWEGPMLFSSMTGLFASHRINILEAQLTLSTQGHALQVFKVTDHEGHPIDDPERWARVEKDLREVLEGRAAIENLVAEKFRPSFFKEKVARRVPTKVEIDNDVSPYYTVIDVYAHDRLGLLYQITSTLSSLGLYVDVSKISTKVDQVADTFYVKDIFGHKITSEERLKRIQQVLTKVIEEEPT